MLQSVFVNLTGGVRAKFKIVNNTRGGQAAFGYASRDRFRALNGPTIHTSGAELEGYLEDSDVCVIVADKIIYGSEFESEVIRDKKVLFPLGHSHFAIRISESGEPLIFERIAPSAYVLLHHGRSGTPRTLYEIAHEFGLTPGRSVLVFARFVETAY